MPYVHEPPYYGWDFSDHEPSRKPSDQEISAALASLKANWAKIANIDIASSTEPIKFTGTKKRRLVVKVKSENKFPWDKGAILFRRWTDLKGFSEFRKSVNEVIAPLEVDHIDFKFPHDEKA